MWLPEHDVMSKVVVCALYELRYSISRADTVYLLFLIRYWLWSQL